MTNFKVSVGSYKVADKWVASGVLLIDEGSTQRDIKLGPSEARFDSKEDADKHIYVLAKKKLPTKQRNMSDVNLYDQNKI